MPDLLDLCCGAGGAAMGYSRAGFDRIVGVDLNLQPRYPFEFIQGDGLEYLAEHGHEFDAIHVSPPCQGYSIMRNLPWLKDKEYPLLIDPFRELLEATGRPWVIENVMGAHLPAGWLCGTMFGLPFYRHRVFETNWFWMQPGHSIHRNTVRPSHSRGGRSRDFVFSELKPGQFNAWCSQSLSSLGHQTPKSNGAQKLGVAVGHAAGWRIAAEAMGIDWMKRDELTQAIPPRLHRIHRSRVAPPIGGSSMSMQPITTFSRALQKMRAAAHLGMGDAWFRNNYIDTKSYQEVVELLRTSGIDGAEVLHAFAKGFVEGMNQAAETSDYQKIRQPDGSTVDRATLVRQAKAEGDLITGWGQVFLKIDPEDPKYFVDFDVNLPGVYEAYQSTFNWFRGIGPGMLLLGGIPGTGKTHLAKATYAYVTSYGRNVFYRREVDLIANLQRAIQHNNVEAVMEEIQTCPWLIIDDYGAAASGPWGRGQLDAIIDARWESADSLRTMLTTNLDADGMKAQSPRIWSRLSDRTRAKRVAMGPDAEDYREKRGS